jgi:hypothetical protein
MYIKVHYKALAGVVRLFCLLTLALVAAGFLSPLMSAPTTAQVRIQVPDIRKPKVPKPKTETPKVEAPATAPAPGNTGGSAGGDAATGTSTGSSTTASPGATANAASGDADEYARQLKEEVGAIDKQIARMATGDGWIVDRMLLALFDRDKYRAEMYATTVYTDKGQTPPAGFYASVDAKTAELLVIAEKHAAAATFPARTGHDAALEAFARTKFKQLHSMTVLKSAMTDTDWKVYKNNVGIPTNRYRHGIVLLRPPAPVGTKWCQHRTFAVKEAYAGGGRWSNRELEYSGSAELMKCQ